MIMDFILISCRLLSIDVRWFLLSIFHLFRFEFLLICQLLVIDLFLSSSCDPLSNYYWFLVDCYWFIVDCYGFLIDFLSIFSQLSYRFHMISHRLLLTSCSLLSIFHWFTALAYWFRVLHIINFVWFRLSISCDCFYRFLVSSCRLLLISCRLPWFLIIDFLSVASIDF